MNVQAPEQSRSITVGLADDQQLVRAGFAMVLDSQEDIQVVWQAVDGREAVRLALECPVDVILMDVQMPNLDGIMATGQIVDAGVVGPLGEPTRVVVLTTFDNDEYVMNSITAGASGFLLKDADPEELIGAVRTVGEASAVISPKATARLMRQVRGASVAPGSGVDGTVTGASGTGMDLGEGGDDQERMDAPSGAFPGGGTPENSAGEGDLGLVDPLTPREREILVLMAKGSSNSEIAAQLFVSLPTVKTHVGRILSKTGSRDRVHAVLFAFRHGLVEPGSVLEG